MATQLYGNPPDEGEGRRAAVNDTSNRLGMWLRQERQLRNWSRLEMARRLISAAENRNDRTMPGVDSVSSNIQRWERGSVAPGDRYQLYTCDAFGISSDRFGGSESVTEITTLMLKGAVTIAISIRPDGAEISITNTPSPNAE